MALSLGAHPCLSRRRTATRFAMLTLMVWALIGTVWIAGRTGGRTRPYTPPYTPPDTPAIVPVRIPEHVAAGDVVDIAAADAGDVVGSGKGGAGRDSVEGGRGRGMEAVLGVKLNDRGVVSKAGTQARGEWMIEPSGDTEKEHVEVVGEPVAGMRHGLKHAGARAGKDGKDGEKKDGDGVAVKKAAGVGVGEESAPVEKDVKGKEDDHWKDRVKEESDAWKHYDDVKGREDNRWKDHTLEDRNAWKHHEVSKGKEDDHWKDRVKEERDAWKHHEDVKEKEGVARKEKTEDEGEGEDLDKWGWAGDTVGRRANTGEYKVETKPKGKEGEKWVTRDQKVAANGEKEVKPEKKGHKLKMAVNPEKEGGIVNKEMGEEGDVDGEVEVPPVVSKYDPEQEDIEVDAKAGVDGDVVKGKGTTRKLRNEDSRKAGWNF